MKECEGLTDAQKKRTLLSDQTNQGGKQVASQQHIMISGLHHLLIQLHHWWSSCSSVHKSTFVKTHWSYFSVVSDSSWEVYLNVVEFCHNTQALRAVDTFCRGPVQRNCQQNRGKVQLRKIVKFVLVYLVILMLALWCFSALFSLLSWLAEGLKHQE